MNHRKRGFAWLGVFVLLGMPSVASAQTSMHYQKTLAFSFCDGGTCTVDFPSVPTGRRLNVTRMSCNLAGQAGSTFVYAQIRQVRPSGGVLSDQVLPLGSSSADGTFNLINTAVDMQLEQGQHLRAQGAVAGGNATGGFCTATGTLSTP